MNDTIARMSVALDARKFEKAARSQFASDEEFLAAIEAKMRATELIERGDCWIDQIRNFRKAIGEEIFVAIAAGPSLVPTIEKWLEDSNNQNVARMVASLKEMLPEGSDVTDNNIRCFLAEASGQLT